MNAYLDVIRYLNENIQAFTRIYFLYRKKNVLIHNV